MAKDDDLSIPIDDADDIPLLGAEEEEVEEETISLNEPLRGQTGMRAIRSSMESGRKSNYKRPMNISGQGATRCRIFHCKIAEAPLDHLENTINEWIDDEGIDVKHVGHMTGPFEGKHTEQNVVICVWY